MSTTGLDVFDRTVHKSNAWLKDLMKALNREDRRTAYVALRTVLHALRDRVGGVADGGEILVSSLVREIASARGDLTFGEARPVELKGIGGEHLVYPVEWRNFAPAS